MDERFLVTGSSGCIGAWTIRRLVQEGVDVVALDVSDDDHRLRMVLTGDELAGLAHEQADIRDLGALARVLADRRITHVVHLAALQVPFCRAGPVLGAEVNVVGTANLLEAARRADGRVRGFSYASSVAVFGTADMYPDGRADDESRMAPQTLYGVYKQANEGTARLYAADYGVGSVGLRPSVVYGPGRDQGISSDPTRAMVKLLRGEPAHIAFGGSTVFQHADDVAATFIASARAERSDAVAVNLGGPRATIRAVAGHIEDAVGVPRGTITNDSDPLPLPSEYDGSGLDSLIGHVAYRSIADGVAGSVEMFRRLLAAGLVRLD